MCVRVCETVNHCYGMAQQRQSGMERFGVRDLHHANGAGDHVAVGIRGGAALKQPRLRRSARSDRATHLSVAAILVFLFLVLVVTVLVFSYISRDGEVLLSMSLFFFFLFLSFFLSFITLPLFSIGGS